MNHPAITLHNVSKKYQFYATSGDRLKEALHPLRRHYHTDFWALRDIDLQIPRGCTFGILGVNGSGKSTLLQIICSILRPTSGTVQVKGRVAALIELGSGFNPEMTGRENAEFNCLLLGVGTKQARAAVPKIEQFADIGSFFDRPMKTLSSGMFMRVAFATAVHVDPEVLVIDEALAVGDARFQQKCFRRFREFQDAGKTIIFVTHDRFLIPRVCSHAMLLHDGRIVCRGDPASVVDQYSKLLAVGPEAGAATQLEKGDGAELPPDENTTIPAALLSDRDLCPTRPNYNPGENRYGTGGAAILDFLLKSRAGDFPETIPINQLVDLIFWVRFNRHIDNPLVGISIKSHDGVLVQTTNSQWLGQVLSSQNKGTVTAYHFQFHADLSAGDWFADVAVAGSETEMLDVREGIIHFRTNSVERTGGLTTLRVSLLEAPAAALSE
jgi:lipopolysaccharide transport system ATP-binding protein